MSQGQGRKECRGYPLKCEINEEKCHVVKIQSHLSTRPPLPTQFSLDFFSPLSLHRTKTIIIDPAQIETFVGLIYDQLEQLCVNTLPITKADYTRMCQTLVLKRVQDVHEKCFHQRSTNLVRIYCNLKIPKPLYDLLSALGRGYDPADGVHYYMTPCAKPSQTPPSWWTIDDTIIGNFVQMSHRLYRLYSHVEFPASSDFDGRAIAVTRVQTVNNMTSVFSKTPTPTPADGLIRMMNPDALFAGDVIPIPQCGFRLCDEQYLESVRYAYIGSGVLDANS